MEIRIAKGNDIEKVYALRNEVFVVEQNVPPEIEISATVTLTETSATAFQQMRHTM